ncbi:MAG: hypothetical protein H2069_07865 [Legionella sp.]|nr:hypothetical protein [Legionella sp.]
MKQAQGNCSKTADLKINGSDVIFSHVNDEVWIAFDKYSGTLKEMIAFRKSFDYECYRFGKGYFHSARWQTVKADDNEHQAYPLEISLCQGNDKINIAWADFENLLLSAREFASEN